MKKILVAGAGGAPSEGVIKSLLATGRFEVIGMGSEPSDLVLSAAKRKYVVPYAYEQGYKDRLLEILQKEKPDLVHFQNDIEVFHASKLRGEILATGTQVYMPPHEVIATCVDKYKSWQKFKAAGVVVPENIFINNPNDLSLAFDELGDETGTIWLRSVNMSGGGKGSIPTNDRQLAKCWIDRNRGWGSFVAAQMLTSKTVTWLSLWHEGELIVAQTRRRTGWIHGNRTASGVTGVTKIGETYSDSTVDKIAMETVRAVTDRPHGIFGVDMAYDKNGMPNPTEINISRFFTTVLFFTKAGLNMPAIYADYALAGSTTEKNVKKLNPLPNGLRWYRGMDTEPLLLRDGDMEKMLIF